MIESLERLAEHGGDHLTAATVAYEDGARAPALINQAREIVATLKAGDPAGLATFLALLHNHSHVLIALARLGLAAAGVREAGFSYAACKFCGSDRVRLKSRRNARSGRTARTVSCEDCRCALTSIGTEALPMPRSSSDELH